MKETREIAYGIPSQESQVYIIQNFYFYLLVEIGI